MMSLVVRNKEWPRWVPEALVVGAAVVVYANTLRATGFILDDQYGIVGNTLLRSWSSLPRLLSVGYWEGATGFGAADQLYRPVPMLAHFLVFQAAGLRVWAYHLLNILAHALNGLLLLRSLRRHYSETTAFAAALLFAVLSVHTEAVAYISELPEVLAATWLLLAWGFLEEPPVHARRGVVFFVLALLTKEQALVFPAGLALYDWAFYRRRFWDPARCGVYAGMATCAAAYLLARLAVLGRAFHVGHDYFAGRAYWTRLLTLARFDAAHLALPTLSGLGLQADFSRPFIPDASLGDLAAWICLAGWGCLFAEAVRRFAGARRGRRPAFWILFAFVFFLPASNVLLRLNVIGAQRHLYFPSIAFCVLAAQGLDVFGHRRVPALAVLASWYAVATWTGNRVWMNPGIFCETQVRLNPRSATARSGLGAYLADAGRTSEAAEALEAAIKSDDRPATPYYNLGKFYGERGDWREAEKFFLEASQRDPDDPDTWVFLAGASERKGRSGEAMERYRRALALRPWDANARFNIGRLLMAAGRNREAAAQFREYLRLDASVPDAPQVRALLTWLESP